MSHSAIRLSLPAVANTRPSFKEKATELMARPESVI
jgi:hypothetical protein